MFLMFFKTALSMSVNHLGNTHGNTPRASFQMKEGRLEGILNENMFNPPIN